MKYILEFTDEEREQFEIAFKAPDFIKTLWTIHTKIRNTLKYKEISPETRKELENIYEDVFDVLHEKD